MVPRKTKQMIANLCCLSAFLISAAGCAGNGKTASTPKESLLQKATETLDSLYAHYSAEGTCLLRENYPYEAGERTASYLASEEEKERKNRYAYLWPYSGTFSAINALAESHENSRQSAWLDERVLPGLEEYKDTLRKPEAYASYINREAPSDRFYDDNIWLGIDFTDSYLRTRQERFLQKALLIHRFIESGTDSLLGGGIYWCEQKKESKNTCSNAPAAVFCLKLFEATQDSSFLKEGRQLYEWTQTHLQDSEDGLYYDNIALDGRISKVKYTYNSGQMMQAAAMLYRLTKEDAYLKEAQRVAEACHSYFFREYRTEEGQSLRILKKGNVWFHTVMLRGFVELEQITGDRKFLESFVQSVNHAWTHARDKEGLFNSDLSGETQDTRKWLLTQAAMVEMYARLAKSF